MTIRVIMFAAEIVTAILVTIVVILWHESICRTRVSTFRFGGSRLPGIKNGLRHPNRARTSGSCQLREGQSAHPALLTLSQLFLRAPLYDAIYRPPGTTR